MENEVKHRKLPEFYFTSDVFWLRTTGIELLRKDEGVLYRVYSAFTIAFLFTYILFECIEFKFCKDFNAMSFVFWYVADHSTTMVKVLVIYKNRKKIGDLMRSFHEGFYKPDRKRGGNYEEEYVRKVLQQSRFQTTIYGIIMAFCWFAGLSSSLQSRLTEKPENWLLPFLSVSFLDRARSPTFEILYVYQSMTTYYICLWIYICNCTVVSIIAQTIAQLRILEGCVRSYKSRNLQLKSGEEKLGTNNLHYTIKYHLNVLNTVDDVEELCSYLVLLTFVVDLILLCLDLYHTSLTPMRSIEFGRFLLYTFHIALQLFMYCWFGNEMTLANEGLALGIFETYNPNVSVSDSKTLRMMLVKAQKPLFFTAGKFVPLSIDTFKSIVKGSFSYFTVLRQVNSE